MVQFDYDKEMKRYYVLVPQEKLGITRTFSADKIEDSMLIVAHIDEYNKITVTKEIHISLLRTILLHWDEYEFQLTKGDI